MLVFKRLAFANLMRRAEEGVTALETAFIAPVLFLFFMGVVEVSLLLLAQHLLENATYNASRVGKTGYVTTGLTQEETVKARLFTELATLSPLIDADNVSMTTTSFGSLSAMTATGTSGLGSSGEVVVYEVTYPWTFFTPMIGDLMSTNGVMTLTARMVVKNEPY